MNGKANAVLRTPSLKRGLEKFVADVFWTDPSPRNPIVITDSVAYAMQAGLNTLTANKRDCICLKYGIAMGKPARYKEIVEHLRPAKNSRNVTREDVRRWIAKGLTKLRRMENLRLFEAA
jgi:DNA-directed RNA polymerase sigma subunit (sigma70/sigma32)